MIDILGVLFLAHTVRSNNLCRKDFFIVKAPDDESNVLVREFMAVYTRAARNMQASWAHVREAKRFACCVIVTTAFTFTPN